MQVHSFGGHGRVQTRGFMQRLTAGALLSVLFTTSALAQGTGYYPVQELLVTGQTVVGEDIQYPTEGAPRITVAVVTVEPGKPAAFHRHPAPLVAYILEGELTVDYGEHGLKTFRKGDALVEAMHVPHRGMNMGDQVVKLLAVYIGAEGVANTVLEK